MRSFIATVAACAATVAAQSMAERADARRKERMYPKFNDDMTFRIVQLTDVSLYDKVQDHETHQFLSDVKRIYKADLVVVTGDLVEGNMWDGVKKDFWVKKAWWLRRALGHEAVAFVPGYHDYEADATVDEMFSWEQDDRFRDVADDDEIDEEEHNEINMVAQAVPNEFLWHGKEMTHKYTYRVPIAHPNDPNQELFQVWMFETGRADCLGLGGFDCIRRDQIEWFKQESRAIRDTGVPEKNGIAFMHHALQEHMMLANDFPVRGQKRDVSSCQGINTGMFAQMVESGTIGWISAGGDHSTDFIGSYGGINLSYGRKTGYGSYGPKFQKPGARFFDLKFDETTGEVSVDSYIVDVDGFQRDIPESKPPAFSWLKSGHCFGSEQVHSVFSSRSHKENYWLPEFLS